MPSSTDGNTRLRILIKTAGLSEELTWLTREQAGFLPTHITNPHVHRVSKYDAGNKLGYPFLIYVNDDNGPPFSVVWYNNQWHECLHDQRSREPFLGKVKGIVNQTDVPKVEDEEPPDEAAQSERPEDSEDEPQNQETRNAPAIIDPSGPGSPY